MALTMPGEQQDAREGSLVVGNITLESGQQRVSVDGRVVGLTAKEFYLAWLLAQRAGQVVAYNTIATGLFGLTGVTETRHLNVLVHRLRTKLGRTHPYAIETVRGRGYGFLEMPGHDRGSSGPTPLRRPEPVTPAETTDLVHRFASIVRGILRRPGGIVETS